MKLFNAILIVSLAFCAFPVHSQASADDVPVVLLAKDRKTNEVLGLKCASVGASEGDTCSRFMFVRATLEVDGDESELVNELPINDEVYSAEQIEKLGEMIRQSHQLRYTPPVFLPSLMIVLAKANGSANVMPLLVLTIPFDLVTALPILSLYTPTWAVAQEVRDRKLEKMGTAMGGADLKRIPRFGHHQFLDLVDTIKISKGHQ